MDERGNILEDISASEIETYKQYALTLEDQPHYRRKMEIVKKYPKIKELYAPENMTAFWILFLVFLQITFAYLLRNSSKWFSFLVAYTVGATACHGLWVLIHDCTHNCVFQATTPNKVMQVIANLVHIYPSSISFRYYHIMHHQYLGEYGKDPDIPVEIEAKIFGTSALGKASWLFFFFLMQPARILGLKKIIVFDFWIGVNWVSNLTFAFIIYSSIGWNALFYLLMSSTFAIGLHPYGARWIQEHYKMVDNQETYDYYGPLNLVAFNMGYHNEHHDLPRVPWNKLPTVKAIAPEYYNDLSYHDSWVKLLLKFVFDPKITLFSRYIRPPKPETAKQIKSITA